MGFDKSNLDYKAQRSNLGEGIKLYSPQPAMTSTRSPGLYLICVIVGTKRLGFSLFTNSPQMPFGFIHFFNKGQGLMNSLFPTC
jgi:hypothetical protein